MHEAERQRRNRGIGVGCDPAKASEQIRGKARNYFPPVHFTPLYKCTSCLAVFLPQTTWLKYLNGTAPFGETWDRENPNFLACQGSQVGGSMWQGLSKCSSIPQLLSVTLHRNLVSWCFHCSHSSDEARRTSPLRR